MSIKHPDATASTGKPRLPLLMVESAVASRGALLVSNPFELIKTRLQLQGELQSAAATRVVYRGMLHGVATVARTEGVTALYQGLASAVCHQIIMNGLRFGLYEPCKTSVEQLVGPGVSTNIVSAFSVGAFGAFVSTPFYLLKTRMQSQNLSAASSKVGTQHHYRGMLDGFRQIYVASGVRGFYNGAVSAIARTGVGSAAQLPMYDFVKATAIRELGFHPQDVRLHVMCSMCAALSIVTFMNPFDVLNVRCFNDPNNKYSKNVLAALLQIARAEGVRGLYKGSLPLWWRTAPHSTTTFVLLEQIRKARHETSAQFLPFLYEQCDA